MVLRRRFFVNGRPAAGSVLHARYLKPAGVMLDQLKQRMAAGGLQQLANRYTTEDGAVLTAMSRFGQDEIRIDVPQGKEPRLNPIPLKSEPHPYEYCTWLPDRFTYSAPFSTPDGSTDPVIGGAFIYLGLHASGDARSVAILDAQTLTDGGSIGMSALQGGVISADTQTGVFTWAGYDNVATGQTLLEQWRADDNSPSVFNAEAAYNHFVDPWNFGMHFGDAIVSQTAPSGGRLVLNAGYSDDGPPWGSHNLWLVTNPDDNSVLLELVDPSWGTANYLTIDAHVTPGGDTLFIHTPNSSERAQGQTDGIHRYATGANGLAQEYPLPDIVGQTQTGDVVNAFIVVLNDDRTIYLRVRAYPEPADYLFLWKGDEWQPLVVDTPIVPMDASQAGLLHDPVTDAVASLDGDGSGAWIFNGRDCFGAVIPPFYIAFKDHPEGCFVTNGQFHDAAIVTSFISQSEPQTIVGRIDVGKLKQTRVTEQGT